MYADHLRARRVDPVGLAGAALIGGAILAALINVAPQLAHQIVFKPLETYPVPPEHVPPPEKPIKKEIKQAPLPDEKPFVVEPIVDHPTPPDPIEFTKVEPPYNPPVIGKAEPIVEPPVAPPPPLIPADIDPRYADDFQPPYPAAELRAEMEGLITVRVQIGADGRVKSIEPVGKGSPGFFDATRRQALSRWRFKPATRGGVAIDSWKTMTVRFQIS